MDTEMYSIAYTVLRAQVSTVFPKNSSTISHLRIVVQSLAICTTMGTVYSKGKQVAAATRRGETRQAHQPQASARVPSRVGMASSGPVVYRSDDRLSVI